eukprot:7844158-Lingulodinium_polyedra.AAC.1
MPECPKHNAHGQQSGRTARSLMHTGLAATCEHNTAAALAPIASVLLHTEPLAVCKKQRQDQE